MANARRTWILALIEAKNQITHARLMSKLKLLYKTASLNMLKYGSPERTTFSRLGFDLTLIKPQSAIHCYLGPETYHRLPRTLGNPSQSHSIPYLISPSSNPCKIC